MDRTVVQHRVMNAVVVGPDGPTAARVASGFARVGVIVERVDDAKSACDKIVRKMPEVVLILEAPRSDLRNALAERAAAVGALLVHVDPELDEQTFEELVDRTARAALERRLRREEADKGPASSTEDPIDSGWD
jgi:hypothetical protein